MPVMSHLSHPNLMVDVVACFSMTFMCFFVLK